MGMCPSHSEPGGSGMSLVAQSLRPTMTTLSHNHGSTKAAAPRTAVAINTIPMRPQHSVACGGVCACQHDSDSQRDMKDVLRSLLRRVSSTAAQMRARQVRSNATAALLLLLLLYTNFRNLERAQPQLNCLTNAGLCISRVLASRTSCSHSQVAVGPTSDTPEKVDTAQICQLSCFEPNSKSCTTAVLACIYRN